MTFVNSTQLGTKIIQWEVKCNHLISQSEICERGNYE